ncbi:uncharacterized protein LOC5518011 [Nematostella vectensis]|uniref:uncharacterized protein LOC5518011 n=1 Tax=Nematostella vectensis TaxID=45351 RepID=UPI00138FF353|nr:uncharacterized protein LOC5518011 [Nematostella vectensis]
MAKRNSGNNNDMGDQSETVVYVNVDYLLSIPAVLKILEFLFLITAMGCMITYDNHWVSYPAELVFFHVVVVLDWIIVLAFFVMMLFTLERRLPGYDWNLCIVFTSFIMGVFLIAAAGLMGHEAVKHQNLEWKDVFSTEIKFTLDHLVAAVILAFIAVLLFIIDIIVHLVKFFRERRRRRSYQE